MRFERLMGTIALFACVAAAQQANSANHSMTINGVDGSPFPILLNVRTSLPATFIWTGLANQPFALYQGTTHAGTLTTPYGIVDLFMNPLPSKILDGFQNPLFRTDASGSGSMVVQVPPVGNPPSGVLVGLLLGEQAVMGDPFNSPYGISLTAATRVTVTQGPIVTFHNNLGDVGDDPLDITSMPIPFYGINYTALYLDANGFVCFGAQDPDDYFPTPSAMIGGPPRVAPFWTDLLCGTNTVKTTLDTNPGGTGSGVPGYLNIEYTNVGEPFGLVNMHTFSMLLRNDGYLEITSASTNNYSSFDQTTGIGPGNNLGGSQPQINFVGAQPPGSSVGAGILTSPPFARVGNVNEAFYEWFGTLANNPYYGNTYDNPFDLYAITLHFQPGGSGTLPGSTNRYTVY